MKECIFAFDFSVSKPAMCALIDGKLHFYCWPASEPASGEAALSAHGVTVRNRGVETISKKKFDTHTLTFEYTKRFSSLCNMIVEDIMDLVEKNGKDITECVIASEGLSFASKGDQTLNLAGAKQVLLCKLYEKGFQRIMTFPPIRLKQIAGCSKKGTTKLDVINAFIASDCEFESEFKTAIAANADDFKARTSFYPCVDDLADSYWCLRAVINELNKEKK